MSRYLPPEEGDPPLARRILDPDVIAELRALPAEVPVIEAIDVQREYGGTMVLRGVSFSIGRGEVKAILGPSGSGKSTLLRCLALLEPLDGGQVRIEGALVGARDLGGGRLEALSESAVARQRLDVGMVFQRFNLFPHLTALANVMIALTEVRGLPRDEARVIADTMLERVGLGHRRTFYPAELSGGQQQRVAMDPELVGDVLRVMEELAREGMTMVVVTHEIGFARGVASRVLMMDEGQIIEEGPPDEFFENPHQPRTRRFLEAVR
jgi:ABC-type polar amino acid transport system ATPase subunit